METFCRQWDFWGGWETGGEIGGRPGNALKKTCFIIFHRENTDFHQSSRGIINLHECLMENTLKHINFP